MRRHLVLYGSRRGQGSAENCISCIISSSYRNSSWHDSETAPRSSACFQVKRGSDRLESLIAIPLLALASTTILLLTPTAILLLITLLILPLHYGVTRLVTVTLLLNFMLLLHLSGIAIP